MLRTMDDTWTPRKQGSLGELSAIEWLGHNADGLFKPLVEHPDHDFVAAFGAKLVRVQVRTSGAWHRNRFVVSLCTRGGNQS
jgi:hypothetical protein